MSIDQGNKLIRFEGSDEYYSLPDDITELADLAFADCSRLITLYIHDSVSVIGNYAFAFCKKSWCRIVSEMLEFTRNSTA